MNDEQLHAMRHSLAHITAAAVKRLWPEAKFGVGPVVENGFYYDIDLGDKKISEDDFGKIEKEMKRIIGENQKFEHSEKPIDEALEWAKENNQPYKQELLNDLKREGTTLASELDATMMGMELPAGISGAAHQEVKSVVDVSFYTNGDFTDLCRGPHVANTKDVGAFKLLRVAGAYWRGKEGNPQMQRLYGVAFATQEELDRHLKWLEEAKERDHRKLGKELDLFVFSDLVGPGLPLFTPRGTTVRRLLTELMRQVGTKYGAQEVEIPPMARRALYEKSGHAQKFSEELFEVKSHYDIEFVLKPVNCPHHIQIFDAVPRSYKDLPIHYMQVTNQHRDEKPGQLGGLQRTRSFAVDDGHIFLSRNNLEEVISGFINTIKEVHGALGMYGDHWVSLSLRDPATPDAYIGDEADWAEAEKTLAEISEKQGLNAKPMEGEAALYGPKLDFMYKTVTGNETQLATIQLDFATPKRFELEYSDENGEKQTPIMVHRAILGSLERFMVILIEKTAGWFPFWIAPEQIRILTINDSVNEYVSEIKAVLDSTVLMQPVKYNELRYTVDDRNESLGKKIGQASSMKIPVQLIVGPQDQEARQVSVRTQAGEEKVALDQLADYLKGL